MKTILITGAAGFIGSHLCDKVLMKGFKVIGADNFFRGKKENLPNHENFSFIKVDLEKYKDVKYLLETYQPDIIAHYAAINGTEYFYDMPWKVVNTNIKLTLNLINALDSLEYSPEKIVYASSSEVYGESPKIPTNENEKIILDVDATRDSYASSKAIGEFIIKSYCIQKGLKYLILRIFNTYGPRMDTTQYGQVIPEFIRKALFDDQFSIIGNGEHTRSFCYVEDHASAVLQLIEQRKNLVVNIGNNEELSILDLAKKICEILGKRFKPVFLEQRKNDPRRRCPDITLQKKIISDYNDVNIDEGLIRTIDWYKNLWIIK